MYGALLYSYLTDQPFRYFASIEANDPKYSMSGHPNLGLQKPSSWNFLGDVFFIINGISFSTTADFCAIARSHDRGVFIGEETGGGYYGNTSGNVHRLVLPHSAIRISIPRTRFSNAVETGKHEARGVIPDFQVIPDIGQVIRQEDVQLHYAFRLAHKR